jgi:predicted RNA methylase
MHSAQELTLSAPIDAIEAHRNNAIALFGEAYDALVRARDSLAHTAPSNAYASYLPDSLVSLLAPRGRSNEREAFIGAVTKRADQLAWTHLLSVSGLERLMDQKAKRQFSQQIEEAPPPATAENCYATMQALFADAGTIFKRGIAEAFSGLDRRFRSHDGFKIGTRVVLSGAMSEHGMWNHYLRRDDAIRDVERTFYVLDGRQQPDRGDGVVGVIDRARPRGLGRSAYEVEDEYFRVRVFKNGNVHLWFLRPDLLERVNQLLADHYGAVLGDARQADAAAPTGRAPAKGFSFFPTPPAVQVRVMEAAALWRAEGLTVLEPSAGTGALAFAAADKGCHVTAIEIQQSFVDQLASDGRLSRVISADFLTVRAEDLGRFDRVIMNPPFCAGRDVDHVRHALSFVAPGGRLVAIMSAGVAYREDAATVAFRERVEAAGGTILDLPVGSFADVGTNVNTCLVTIPVGVSQ